MPLRRGCLRLRSRQCDACRLRRSKVRLLRPVSEHGTSAAPLLLLSAKSLVCIFCSFVNALTTKILHYQLFAVIASLFPSFSLTNSLTNSVFYYICCIHYICCNKLHFSSYWKKFVKFVKLLRKWLNRAVCGLTKCLTKSLTNLTKSLINLTKSLTSLTKSP